MAINVSSMMSKAEINDLELRIAKLERAVFYRPKKVSRSKVMDGKYDGLTGGIRMLIDCGFFKKPRQIALVQDELEQEGYFRPIESTWATLDKNFVKQKILSRRKINGTHHYVLRKK